MGRLTDEAMEEFLAQLDTVRRFTIANNRLEVQIVNCCCACVCACVLGNETE